MSGGIGLDLIVNSTPSVDTKGPRYNYNTGSFTLLLTLLLQRRPILPQRGLHVAHLRVGAQRGAPGVAHRHALPLRHGHHPVHVTHADADAQRAVSWLLLFSRRQYPHLCAPRAFVCL